MTVVHAGRLRLGGQASGGPPPQTGRGPLPLRNGCQVGRQAQRGSSRAGPRGPACSAERSQGCGEPRGSLGRPDPRQPGAGLFKGPRGPLSHRLPSCPAPPGAAFPPGEPRACSGVQELCGQNPGPAGGEDPEPPGTPEGERGPGRGWAAETSGSLTRQPASRGAGPCAVCRWPRAQPLCARVSSAEGGDGGTDLRGLSWALDKSRASSLPDSLAVVGALSSSCSRHCPCCPPPPVVTFLLSGHGL